MDELAASAFRRHYVDVLRFVRKRSPAFGSDAEDITQSVFVKAVGRLGSAERNSPPVRAWLYTVARHRLIDEARRTARQGASIPLEEAALQAAQPRYGNAVANALRMAIAGLPEPQRAVVVMRLVEGRSFAEIARQLDATEAACKMRFRRGLSAVRDVFEREGIAP
jgi:RNA polymerase sigma-70 factor (ECF subfamily)